MRGNQVLKNKILELLGEQVKKRDCYRIFFMITFELHIYVFVLENCLFSFVVSLQK